MANKVAQEAMDGRRVACRRMRLVVVLETKTVIKICWDGPCSLPGLKPYKRDSFPCFILCYVCFNDFFYLLWNGEIRHPWDVYLNIFTPGFDPNLTPGIFPHNIGKFWQSISNEAVFFLFSFYYYVLFTANLASTNFSSNSNLGHNKHKNIARRNITLLF